ncbi:MAG: FHA domain-containing protein [Clostridiales bacterium]|nr:FHA domain-containing protein [Clostridiales bacterium]
MKKNNRYRIKGVGPVLLTAFLAVGTALAVSTETVAQPTAVDAPSATTAPETTAAPEMEHAVATGGRRIEQVYLNMPEIVVYGSGFTWEEIRDGEGYLGQEKLTLEQEPQLFGETGEGVGYYVLVDISASISNRSFDYMKDAIQILQDELGSEDRLSLYAFGDEVTQVTDGSQTAGEMTEALEALDNDNQETLLFEAIYQAAADAEKETGLRRKVMIVLTDGEDFAVGKTQAGEALERLQECQVPAYAFGPDGTNKEYLNSLGEFARSSGGTMTVFERTGDARMLAELRESLATDIRVGYRASSNLVSYETEVFSLKLADGVAIRKNVVSDHWIPDEEAPYLAEWEYVGGSVLRLLFSEPLNGMDVAANYQVRYSGEEGETALGVVAVAVDETSSCAVKLTLDKPVWNGTYQLTFANLTDVSMEKNPLAESSLSIEIENAEDREDRGEDESQREGQEPEPTPGLPREVTGLLFLIFAALIFVAVVVIVTSKKKKASHDAESAEKKDGRIRMEVSIRSEDGLTALSVWELDSRLLVGRSPSCDVCLDDRELSRRHFCLEREGANVYISDLNSTNGTQVNGKTIQGRCPLISGDQIEAGTQKMTVRW